MEGINTRSRRKMLSFSYVWHKETHVLRHALLLPCLLTNFLGRTVEETWDIKLSRIIPSTFAWQYIQHLWACIRIGLLCVYERCQNSGARATSITLGLHCDSGIVDIARGSSVEKNNPELSMFPSCSGPSQAATLPAMPGQ
jgi:hypothetical protein